MPKRISCAYGKCPNNKSYESTCDAMKRRKINTSMKEQYGCLFKIRYSFFDYNEGMKKHL